MNTVTKFVTNENLTGLFYKCINIFVTGHSLDNVYVQPVEQTEHKVNDSIKSKLKYAKAAIIKT